MQKKTKGSALIVVIMVMAVMTILGTSMLNISLSETKQASNEDKRIQAHYLARSGAEATLSAWKNAAIGSKPIGISSPVYLNNLNQFVDAQPPNMIGKFVVTITNQGSITTIITSVGTVGNLVQTTTITITSVTTQITDPPGPTVSGDSLEWYDPHSGQANEKLNPDLSAPKVGPSGVIVLVSDPGLKLVHGPVAYQADGINFTTDIWNFKHSITLNAGMIVFNKQIDMNRNGHNDGKLILQVLSSKGVNRSGIPGKWGRIQYNSQWYYFSNNKEILTGTGFNSLEKILTTDPNFPVSPTRTISSYSIKWS